MKSEVTDAVAAGQFHLWAVSHVSEALELLLGAPIGEADANGAYPPDSIFGQVTARLSTFNEAIADTFRKGEA